MPMYLREWRKTKNMTLKLLAGQLGRSASLLSRIETGQVALTTDLAEQISSLYGIEPGDLYCKPPEMPKRNQIYAVTELNFVHSTINVKRVLPGNDRNTFCLTEIPAAQVFCPPGLALSKSAYAIFVPDHSMVPRFSCGDLIFLNPDRPVPIGWPLLAIKYSDGDHPNTITLGILENDHPDAIHIRRLNPAATISLSKDTPIHIHRICALTELFCLS